MWECGGAETVLRSDCVKFSPVTSHSQSLSEPISALPVGNFPLSPHWLVKSNYWKTVISSEEIQIYLSYSNLLGELPWWYQVAEEGIACRIFVWLMWYCEIITRLTPRWQYNGGGEAGNAEWLWLCPPAHLECFISFLSCDNWWRDKIVWVGLDWVQLNISRPTELMKDFYREILYWLFCKSQPGQGRLGGWQIVSLHKMLVDNETF